MAAAEGAVAIIDDPADVDQQLNWLLQLPEAALGLLVQMLYKQQPSSVGNLAIVSSGLSTAVPAYALMGELKIRCRSEQSVTSLSNWLQKHSNSVTQRTVLSVSLEAERLGKTLPCLHVPNLGQLLLQGVTLRSELPAGRPSVLQDCAGLTGLSLRSCVVSDMAAVLAALPGLRNLRGSSCMVGCGPDPEAYPLAAGQSYEQLTALQLGFFCHTVAARLTSWGRSGSWQHAAACRTSACSKRVPAQYPRTSCPS
jgi:hypothetical protein